MDSRNISGFRICTKIFRGDNTESRKCFIFIDERWSKIKNVQGHIKDIFNIDEEVDIYIGDVLLPENETIKLIQPNDILIVRTVRKDNSCSEQFNLFQNDVDSPSRLKKLKKIPVSNSIDPSEKLLADCLEELRHKKEQIVKGSVHEIDSVSIVNDGNEVESLFGIPPKKRKRKHKKKSKVVEETCSVEDTNNETDSMVFDSLDSSSKHIHFSDEDNKEEFANSSKVNGNTIEDFRSSLRDLVCKPASQKIFSRKSETPVINVSTISNFEAPKLDSTTPKPDENKPNLVNHETFVPKLGDLISFKKIKLGNDYTPQKSNDILGEVMTVERSPDSFLVVFHIKEGNDEFENPSGKFSLEVDEDKLEGDKIHVAEMRWQDVLEPRLIKRV